ncbi:MAG: CapA family protein [Lachnospiraceae bacterium]|nr:CapA family protein [Lachnospiraceae bacterium]
MKKTFKKKILYFIVAFSLTVLIGTIGLFFYSEYIKKDRTENSYAVSVIETDDGSVVQQELQKEPEVPEDVQMADGSEEVGESDGLRQEDSDVTEQLPKQEETGSVTLTFGGDICFHDPFANMGSLAMRGGSIESCIDAALLSEMRQADICMVNNEFPYSNRGTPIPEKAFTFRSKPENVKLLHEMGVDIVSLANNHAYDHGEIALLDTLDILEGAGVKYVGAGRDLKEASEASYFEINGVKIAIVAATQIERLDTPDTKGATENSPGVLRCFTESELNHFLEVVGETKKNCDVLIVYIHWGTENTDELDWAQPYQAQLISGAGADLIVGAHPHCLQGLDSVNGVPVIYSLGNYWFNSKTVDTALLKVTAGVDGVKAVQILPAIQRDCSTAMLYDGEKQRVLDYLQSLSPNITLDSEGFMSW